MMFIGIKNILCVVCCNLSSSCGCSERYVRQCTEKIHIDY